MRLLAYLPLLLLAACGTMGTIDRSYTGADAGTMVIGISASKNTKYQSYVMSFRRISKGDEGSGDVGVVRFDYSNMFTREPTDFDNDSESGVVVASRLPPGRYEFYTFGVNTGGKLFYPKHEFSIPFIVEPGKTTYVGHYRAQGFKGKNLLGWTIPVGVFFYVEEKLDHDIAIARGRGDALGTATVNQTPNPDEMGNPLFQSLSSKNAPE